MYFPIGETNLFSQKDTTCTLSEMSDCYFSCSHFIPKQ